MPPETQARDARSSSVIDNPTMSACDAGYTSRQHNTHITEARVLLYPWHPWHGRTVLIFGSVAKNRQAVFRCGLESAQTDRPLEVPQWMFDPTACCQVHLAASPAVRCEELLDLKRLLIGTHLASDKAVLQAEHCTLPYPGGIDAPHEKPTTGHSTPSVPREPEDAAVGEPASRGSATDCASAGATAAPTSAAGARRYRRAGGVR